MTKQQLFKAVRDLGLTVEFNDGEYRIAPKMKDVQWCADTQERQAYYTTDDQDALDTAFTMAMLKGATT